MMQTPKDLVEDNSISQDLPYWIERFFPEDVENYEFRDTIVPLATKAAGTDSWCQSLERLTPQQKCCIWHEALKLYEANAQ